MFCGNFQDLECRGSGKEKVLREGEKVSDPRKQVFQYFNHPETMAGVVINAAKKV